MNSLEKTMLKTLIDLKENHDVVGVKAEFEAEGSTYEDVKLLKQLADTAGLSMTIKIGGCEALRDIKDAREINVQNIIAPMIESGYALKKYHRSIQLAFSEEERKTINFFINIETKAGFDNLDEIFNTPAFEDIDGVVFGRSDMCESLNLSCEEINSDKMLFYVKTVAQKTFERKKSFILGGKINCLSLPFINQLPKEQISKVETRKIIFDAKKAFSNTNLEDGIEKAIEFELMWIKNKLNYTKTIYDADLTRIEILENLR